MEWIITIYTAILFIIFSPNFLFKFPKKLSKLSIIIINTIIFALIFHLTIRFIKIPNKIYENISNNNSEIVNICNSKNINKYNNLGQRCVKRNDLNYAWDIECNSKNVGATSFSGNINLECVNIKGNTYNWIPTKL